jgi:hypothetical protein
MLPPKALQALVDIKATLLSNIAKNDPPESVIITVSPRRNEGTSTSTSTSTRMRHARSSNGSFQRMCRRKDWASPVY